MLRLHPDDVYKPCSAEWFASRSSLWDDERGERLARLGECSLKLAVEKQRELGEGVEGAGRRIRLGLDPLARGGQSLDELDDKVPLYVRAHLAVPPPLERGGGGEAASSSPEALRPRLEITYLALYAYNGPYFPFSETFGPGLGAHDGDLERLTVRLDAESGEVSFFFFFSFFSSLSGRGRKILTLFALFVLSLSLSIYLSIFLSIYLYLSISLSIYLCLLHKDGGMLLQCAQAQGRGLGSGARHRAVSSRRKFRFRRRRQNFFFLFLLFLSARADRRLRRQARPRHLPDERDAAPRRLLRQRQDEREREGVGA